LGVTPVVLGESHGVVDSLATERRRSVGTG